MTTDPFFSNATTFFLVVFHHRSFHKYSAQTAFIQLSSGDLEKSSSKRRLPSTSCITNLI